MEPLFSQQFCSVVPYTAGGALVAGRKMRSCLIQIVDGELVIIEAPHRLVDRAQVSVVELDTPAWARKLGAAATCVRMNDNRWAIDFGGVGVAERGQAARSGGVKSILWAVVGGGTVKAIQRAKQLNRDFRALLVREGATDRRPSS